MKPFWLNNFYNMIYENIQSYYHEPVERFCKCGNENDIRHEYLPYVTRY
jgi:hypothetical protein